MMVMMKSIRIESRVGISNDEKFSFLGGFHSGTFQLIHVFSLFLNRDSSQAADYWFWIPLLLPHFGAVLAAGTYAIMISAHHPEE